MILPSPHQPWPGLDSRKYPKRVIRTFASLRAMTLVVLRWTVDPQPYGKFGNNYLEDLCSLYALQPTI